MSQSPRTKIVYLIGSMIRGGAEGQVLHLLRHFNDERFESSLYLLSGVGDHLEEVRSLGVKVRDFGLPRGFLSADAQLSWSEKMGRRAQAGPMVLDLVRRIRDALREDRPDVLHCFLFWANVFGTRAGRSARTPHIVTSRRSLGNYMGSRFWMQWMENWSNGRVEAVTVNSKAVRGDVMRREKIDPKLIRLLYNGVDVDRTPDAKKAEVLRGELNGADPAGARGPLIACIANFIHYKGHLGLIEAMAEVARKVPGSRLLLVGRDGGMERSIREQIARRGLESRVFIQNPAGPIDHVYAAADLIVHPSDEEGFSNVILEAMAQARPIVATAVGGIPEAIGDGAEGLLTPPGDPAALARVMIRILGDPALAAELGQAARRRAETEFSLQTMFSRYENFYDELTS